MSSKVLRIGHRGAKGYAPENTLASFGKALELGVDMVELDVYFSRDRQLVVIHDRKVDRTTNGRGYVAEKSLKELKKLKLGQNQVIPTLEEALDLINRRLKVNIELKSTGIARAMAKALKKYVKEKGWTYDDFLVSSFNHRELREFRRICPEIKIGALASNILINLAKFAQDLGAYSLHADIDFINKELVRDARKRGLKVFVWVANDPDDIRRMKNLGVDGIISDFPDRIK